MSRLLSSVSGLFGRPSAPAPAAAISYGANREQLIQQGVEAEAVEARGNAMKLKGRFDLGQALAGLKQLVEDEQGPGQWLHFLAQHFPRQTERSAQRRMLFSRTSGKQEDWDKVCGRPATMAVQPHTPPDLQTPPPGEQGNDLPDPLAPLLQEPAPSPLAAPPPTTLGANPPTTLRLDQEDQGRTQTPHGPVGLPLGDMDDDAPLATSWTHHAGDGEITVDYPRAVGGAEIVSALELALAQARAEFSAPF